MPSFGRISLKQSNRSQQNLVEQQLQQQQQQQQQQQLQQQQYRPQQQPQATPPLSSPALATASLSGRGASAAPTLALSSASSAAFSSQDSFHLEDPRHPPPPVSHQQHSPLLNQQTKQQQQQQLHQIQQQQQAAQIQASRAQQLPQPQFQAQPPSSVVQHQQLPQGLPPLLGSGNNSSNPGLAAQALTSKHPAAAYTSPSPSPSPNLNPPLARSPNSSSSTHHANQDFGDLVSRSQSTRYPSQGLQQQHFGSASVDNLALTQPAAPSPAVSQSQPQFQGPVASPPQLVHLPSSAAAPQPQPPQSSPSEPKRSARNLIKRIVAASSVGRSLAESASQSQAAAAAAAAAQPSGAYDNTAGLARRPSKRSSNPFPPSIRTSGIAPQPPSDPQTTRPDWQQPQQRQRTPPSSLSAARQPTTPSPLQSVGEAEQASYIRDQDPLPQFRAAHPPEPRPRPHHSTTATTTIRQIPTDVGSSSPYSANEDVAFQQSQQSQLQAQQLQHAHTPTSQIAGGQQQLYGHVVVDPAQDPRHHQYSASQGSLVQFHSGTSPHLYDTRHLGADPQQQNPETISQLSHDSPATDSDRHSSILLSEQTTPSLSYVQLAQHRHSPSSDIMAPPPGQPAATRRSGDNEKPIRGTGTVEPPLGPPPGYRHSQTAAAQGAMPPTPGVPGSTQNYRPTNVSERQQFDGSGADTGRNSPQPSTAERDADPEKQFKDLLTKYKNVKRLYFDGKAQIEQLNGQIEQLQNAVANQRISQSRTALDDSEYTTRFQRLNGAINNLAFNIRKDWRSLPPWIERYVSTEALKTGKQEMTAVGRAVIMRWIADEIFNKCFHPGLDIELSQHLKVIEHNIRRFSYTLNTTDEYEALTSKVVSWRMATLEGLQRSLQAPESEKHKEDFTTLSTSNLTAHLFQHLVEPPPPGVDGSVGMIVELAVGIAANLSLESRDVAINYPLPGDTVQAETMEPEKASLPPLPEPDEGDDSGKDSEKSSKRGDKTKSGMLNMLGGQQQPPSRKSSVVSNTDIGDATAPPPKDPTKVRFAGFISVEVRGRQILVKAPVWTMS